MGLKFAEFEIDPERRELRRDGREIALQPLIFDLVLHFARHPNALVTKQDLIRDVWKSVVVGDGSISQAVSILRRVLGSTDGARPSLRTVWGHGYRFDAEVIETGPDATNEGDAPSPAACSGATPLVGRADVMGLLERALADARRGDARVVLLAGEPGIGKTRVCLELTRVARAGGARVFTAHVPETGGAPTYWAWDDLWRQAVATLSDEARAAAGSGMFASAMSGLRGGDAGREPLPNERERFRFELFERVASFWTSLADAGPIVLILDDAHRADVDSLDLLHFVVDRGADRSILIVVTLRPVEMRLHEARARAAGALARRPNAVFETLRRLSRDDVAALVTALTGRACDEDRATMLLERSGGNPFLLKELVWLSMRRPAAEGNATDDPSVPLGLLPAIERHLDVVSSPCRDALTIASVIGREFDVPVLATVCGLPVKEVAAWIDEAVHADVVTPLPDARQQFAHALIRDALYEALSSPRRLELHARVGRAVESIYGRGDEYVGPLADHFFRAAGAGEADRALTYLTQAARAAMRAGAFREAIAQYERAKQIAPLAHAGDGTWLRLQVELAEAAANVGDFETVAREARPAMEAARRQGAAAAFARAAHALSLRSEADVPDPEVGQAVEEAVERYDAEDPLRVRLLARLANAKWFSAPPAVSRDLALRAVDLGRRVGDPDSLAHALARAYRIVQGAAADVETQHAFTQEMLDLLPNVRGPVARLDCRWHTMGDAVQRGDRLAVDQRIDGMLRETSASPHPFAEWYAMSFRVVRLQLDGQFAAAEAEARRGATLPAPGIAFATFVLALQLHGIHLAQERGHEHLDEFRTHAPADRPPIARVYVALFELRNDRRLDAEATFASVVADDLAAIPRDVNWMNTLVPLAELCVALGRGDSAEALYDHLLPFAALHSWIGASWLHNGAIARRLGLLAELLGRHDDAERLVRDAVERDTRMGAPAFVARGCFDLARMLRRRGGRAARTEAIGLLREAASEAARLEMPDLRADAAGLLES